MIDHTWYFDGVVIYVVSLVRRLHLLAARTATTMAPSRVSVFLTMSSRAGSLYRIHAALVLLYVVVVQTQNCLLQ